MLWKQKQHLSQSGTEIHKGSLRVKVFSAVCNRNSIYFILFYISYFHVTQSWRQMEGDRMTRMTLRSHTSPRWQHRHPSHKAILMITKIGIALLDITFQFQEGRERKGKEQKIHLWVCWVFQEDNSLKNTTLSCCLSLSAHLQSQGSGELNKFKQKHYPLN